MFYIIIPCHRDHNNHALLKYDILCVLMLTNHLIYYSHILHVIPWLHIHQSYLPITLSLLFKLLRIEHVFTNVLRDKAAGIACIFFQHYSRTT